MIQGKRITLRPFTPDDLATLRRWHDDGEVMQYWGERQPLVAASAFAEELKPGGRFQTFGERGDLCLCDEEMRPIGRFGYRGVTSRDRHAELLLFIGEPHAWNQGYGPEALIVLMNWLFNHQNMHRVWLTVQAENPRAIRAYEKVGFKREGILREHYFRDGHWGDEIVFGMLSGEFNALYHPERTGWNVTGELRSDIKS